MEDLEEVISPFEPFKNFTLTIADNNAMWRFNPETGRQEQINQPSIIKLECVMKYGEEPEFLIQTERSAGIQEGTTYLIGYCVNPMAIPDEFRSLDVVDAEWDDNGRIRKGTFRLLNQGQSPYYDAKAITGQKIAGYFQQNS